MKKGYNSNIEQLTTENTNFRKVLYTATHVQLVLMTLNPGEEIGLEVHEENDQFFRFEKGEGKVLVNDTTYTVGDGSTVIIPAGSKHNVVNTSTTESLHMYTIYAGPHHKDGTVHVTKSDAEKSDEEFDGVVSE